MHSLCRADRPRASGCAWEARSVVVGPLFVPGAAMDGRIRVAAICAARRNAAMPPTGGPMSDVVQLLLLLAAVLMVLIATAVCLTVYALRRLRCAVRRDQ